jgi:hypothetical protein
LRTTAKGSAFLERANDGGRALRTHSSRGES